MAAQEKHNFWKNMWGPKRTERSKLRSQNLSEQIALWVSKLQKEVRGHIIKSAQSDLCRLKLQLLIMWLHGSRPEMDAGSAEANSC